MMSITAREVMSTLWKWRHITHIRRRYRNNSKKKIHIDINSKVYELKRINGPSSRMRHDHRKMLLGGGDKELSLSRDSLSEVKLLTN